MAESMSLLDECRESILKIAATQPPDGKRAILRLAELFRVNSGRKSSDGRRSSSREFEAADWQPLRSRRLRSR
jgi:hypothetical protein